MDRGSERNPAWDEQCETNLTFNDAEKYLYTTANRMFVTVGVPVVVVTGLIGNIVFLVVLYRIKQMRNVTNFYLANLAVADSCLLFISALQYFWTYLHSPLDINFVFATDLGCALPNFVVYLCYFASVWLVTLVATERYMAICHPLKHHIITGTYRSFRLVAISWCLAFLMTCFAAPYGNPDIVCIEWPKEGPYANLAVRIPVCKGICDWCDKTLYAIDPTQFLFAFCINTCMYGRIISILNRRTVSNHDMECSSVATYARVLVDNRNQVARMLMVNTVVFFVCLMPYCIMNINSLAKEIYSDGFLYHREEQIMSWISKLTTLLNSAVNPYLYSVTNKRYRKAFMQAFNCSKNRAYRRRSSFMYTKGSTLVDTKV